jgi:AraC family transcriptional regulator
MGYSENRMLSVMAGLSEARRCPRRATVIEDEPQWRLRPTGSGADPSVEGVVATRWHALAQGTREVSAETANDCHLLKIVLRTGNIRFSVSGRMVHDGIAMPGMLHITEPCAPARCELRGPYDVLHLHVPNALIAECGRDRSDGQVAALPWGKNLNRDPVVERLGRALLESDCVGGSLGQLYLDCVSTAIVARLLASSCRSGPPERSKPVGLAKWRLKRAIDYIEDRLAEPVSLADISSVTGLSRMHFAAQFKAATGLRPHEYLLRRRIERAQEMLVRAGASVVDVALAVGFDSQSHFTGVFKRFVGQPPHAWRQSHSRQTSRIHAACRSNSRIQSSSSQNEGQLFRSPP